jgi:hypothetical protein
VKGGACKSCGSKQHLIKHCPVRLQAANANVEASGDFQSALEESNSPEEQKLITSLKPKQRVVKF